MHSEKMLSKEKNRELSNASKISRQKLIITGLISTPRFSIFANMRRSTGFLQIFADMCRFEEK